MSRAVYGLQGLHGAFREQQRAAAPRGQSAQGRRSRGPRSSGAQPAGGGRVALSVDFFSPYRYPPGSLELTQAEPVAGQGTHVRDACGFTWIRIRWIDVLVTDYVTWTASALRPGRLYWSAAAWEPPCRRHRAPEAAPIFNVAEVAMEWEAIQISEPQAGIRFTNVVRLPAVDAAAIAGAGALYGAGAAAAILHRRLGTPAGGPLRLTVPSRFIALAREEVAAALLAVGSDTVAAGSGAPAAPSEELAALLRVRSPRDCVLRYLRVRYGDAVEARRVSLPPALAAAVPAMTLPGLAAHFAPGVPYVEGDDIPVSVGALRDFAVLLGLRLYVFVGDDTPVPAASYYPPRSAWRRLELSPAAVLVAGGHLYPLNVHLRALYARARAAAAAAAAGGDAPAPMLELPALYGPAAPGVISTALHEPPPRRRRVATFDARVLAASTSDAAASFTTVSLPVATQSTTATGAADFLADPEARLVQRKLLRLPYPVDATVATAGSSSSLRDGVRVVETDGAGRPLTATTGGGGLTRLFVAHPAALLALPLQAMRMQRRTAVGAPRRDASWSDMQAAAVGVWDLYRIFWELVARGHVPSVLFSGGKIAAVTVRVLAAPRPPAFGGSGGGDDDEGGAPLIPRDVVDSLQLPPYVTARLAEAATAAAAAGARAHHHHHDHVPQACVLRMECLPMPPGEAASGYTCPSEYYAVQARAEALVALLRAPALLSTPHADVWTAWHDGVPGGMRFSRVSAAPATGGAASCGAWVQVDAARAYTSALARLCAAGDFGVWGPYDGWRAVRAGAVTIDPLAFYLVERRATGVAGVDDDDAGFAPLALAFDRPVTLAYGAALNRILAAAHAAADAGVTAPRDAIVGGRYVVAMVSHPSATHSLARVDAALDELYAADDLSPSPARASTFRKNAVNVSLGRIAKSDVSSSSTQLFEADDAAGAEAYVAAVKALDAAEAAAATPPGGVPDAERLRFACAPPVPLFPPGAHRGGGAAAAAEAAAAAADSSDDSDSDSDVDGDDAAAAPLPPSLAADSPHLFVVTATAARRRVTTSRSVYAAVLSHARAALVETALAYAPRAPHGVATDALYFAADTLEAAQAEVRAKPTDLPSIRAGAVGVAVTGALPGGGPPLPGTHAAVAAAARDAAMAAILAAPPSWPQPGSWAASPAATAVLAAQQLAVVDADEVLDEVDARIAATPAATPLLLAATTPGAGKSTTVIDWAVRHGATLLAAFPTHALAGALRPRLPPGSRAVTLYSMLGLRPGDDGAVVEDEEVAPPPLDDDATTTTTTPKTAASKLDPLAYDALLVDELGFMTPAVQWKLQAWLRRVAAARTAAGKPPLRVFATYDGRQLGGIGARPLYVPPSATTSVATAAEASGVYGGAPSAVAAQAAAAEDAAIVYGAGVAAAFAPARLVLTINYRAAADPGGASELAAVLEAAWGPARDQLRHDWTPPPWTPARYAAVMACPLMRRELSTVAQLAALPRGAIVVTYYRASARVYGALRQAAVPDVVPDDDEDVWHDVHAGMEALGDVPPAVIDVSAGGGGKRRRRRSTSAAPVLASAFPVGTYMRTASGERFVWRGRAFPPNLIYIVGAVECGGGGGGSELHAVALLPADGDADDGGGVWLPATLVRDAFCYTGGQTAHSLQGGTVRAGAPVVIADLPEPAPAASINSVAAWRRLPSRTLLTVQVTRASAPSRTFVSRIPRAALAAALHVVLTHGRLPEWALADTGGGSDDEHAVSFSSQALPRSSGGAVQPYAPPSPAVSEYLQDDDEDGGGGGEGMVWSDDDDEAAGGAVRCAGVLCNNPPSARGLSYCGACEAGAATAALALLSSAGAGGDGGGGGGAVARRLASGGAAS